MRARRVIGFYAVLLLLLCPVTFAAGASVADAAKNRDLQTVRTLLKQGMEVNARQLDGATALHWAARWDDLEMVDVLIRAGANVSARNRNGSTPMMLACESGNASIIQKLLDAGADPNGNLGLNGETPLMMAARSGSVEAVKILLDRGATVDAKENARGTTALMWAVSENRAQVARLLISRGADKNAQSKIVIVPPARGKKDPSKDGGATPLIIALRERAKDAVQILLEAGVDVNQTAADGSSPMLVAAMNQDHDLGAILLKNGADSNIANDRGWTPLYLTVGARYPHIGSIPTPDQSELSAIDFIQMLLEHGADPNSRIGSATVLANVGDPRWLREPGATPFLRAAISGDVPAMNLLLAYGADPTITTLDKTTALMAAAGVGWAPGVNQEISESVTVEAVKLCLDLGLDVNAANTLGITALHGAATRGANAVVQVLVDHGANLTKAAKAPYLGQKFELIPLDFAVGVPLNVLAPVGHIDTAELLRKLMTEKGIPIPKTSRQQAIDNTLANTAR